MHNASNGLPPHVQQLLLEFEASNPGICIAPWGIEELRIIFRSLSIEDKQSWFGSAPSEETKANLGYKDLQVVLERISSSPYPQLSTVKDVPMGKIEANSLSENIVILLKGVMVKTVLVQQFFDDWYDQAFGERIAKAFRDKYIELRAQHTPNRIFYELQSWAGGNQRGTPEQELAVLAVIAYYFERCDIFEEPRGYAA